MSGEGVRVPARVGVPVFDEQVDRLEGCVRQLSVMRERILAGVTPGELTGPCPKRLALAEARMTGGLTKRRRDAGCRVGRSTRRSLRSNGA